MFGRRYFNILAIDPDATSAQIFTTLASATFFKNNVILAGHGQGRLGPNGEGEWIAGIKPDGSIAWLTETWAEHERLTRTIVGLYPLRNLAHHSSFDFNPSQAMRRERMRTRSVELSFGRILPSLWHDLKPPLFGTLSPRTEAVYHSPKGYVLLSGTAENGARTTWLASPGDGSLLQNELFEPAINAGGLPSGAKIQGTEVVGIAEQENQSVCFLINCWGTAPSFILPWQKALMITTSNDLSIMTANAFGSPLESYTGKAVANIQEGGCYGLFEVQAVGQATMYELRRFNRDGVEQVGPWPKRFKFPRIPFDQIFLSSTYQDVFVTGLDGYDPRVVAFEHNGAPRPLPAVSYAAPNERWLNMAFATDAQNFYLAGYVQTATNGGWRKAVTLAKFDRFGLLA